MLAKAIESLEAEIDGLKDRVALVIKEIYAYLSLPSAKTKLRPRIMEHKGYSTFSIVWQKLVYFDFINRRAKFKVIRKGPTYLVPRSRLFSHSRNCPDWEIEYLWEKELGFARVRMKLALLSQALSALKKYVAIEPETAPEPCDCEARQVTAVAAMEPQKVVTVLVGALRNLKERACREVAEVFAHLAAEGRSALRPRIMSGKAADAFLVEWVRPNGSDPATGQAVERVISREGRRSIRRSRLLAHCRDCDEMEQECIWEKESGFGRVRRQVDLLGQATRALKQYIKEAD